MCCRSTKAMLMAALLGAGPVVWSAPASAATADEIQAGLQDWFANALPQSRAGVTAQLDGTVSVTAAGSGFSAMLPPIRLSLGSHAHSALLIESVTVDLQPLLSGGYAANWSLPETIALQGPDGAQATITIAERSGHGLYSPDLALMVSTDFDLRDIQVAADGRAPHLALDSLAAGMRYDAVAPGSSTNPPNFTSAGFPASTRMAARCCGSPRSRFPAAPGGSTWPPGATSGRRCAGPWAIARRPASRHPSRPAGRHSDGPHC